MRRSLARLFARTGVRDLPAERIAVAVKVRGSDAALTPPVEAGVQENVWRPRTQALLLLPPGAVDGGGGADLATVATVIGGNAALRPAACRVRSLSVEAEGGAVLSWDGPFSTRSVPVKAPVAFRPAGTAAVPLLSGQVQTRREKAALTLRGGRSVAALGRLAEIPMTRARLVSEGGFAAERAHLAAASGVPVEDVALVGVYPHVPLAAVGQLAVGDEGGCLRIWLKSSAIGPKPVTSVKLVTVVFGRQRSTGRTLQAVIAKSVPPAS